MPKKYNVTKQTIFVLPSNLDGQTTKNVKETLAADFETAISATGFGRYNILIILMAIPCGWSSIFETTTMSYVFPAAQCDLNLSLSDKGLLNAITYLGMMSSAIVWGFLVDTLGRKKLLMIGFLLDAMFVFLSSVSQNVALLMFAKYMGGFIINGPFAALMSYVSEFHSARHRARMQMVLGSIFSCGSIILTLLAWVVLPQNLNFSLFNGYLNFHSWNVYLVICGLPSFISAIIFIFLPESPKFLMTMGRNDKALQVFRKVYSINTGKSPDTYPIKALVDETNLKSKITANRTKIQAMQEGWQQMKPLFQRPHLKNIILVCGLQMMFTMTLNTLRLWIPQIFQAINDYMYYNNVTNVNLCDALDLITPHSNESVDCTVNLDNSPVYVNSLIIATVTAASYLLAGYLIIALGKKKLLCLLGFIGGFMGISLYYSTNVAMTLALYACFITAGSVATNVVLAVNVDLFPTTLRTMTVSLSMMLARGGAMIGNLLFPILLLTGCAPPFFLIGSVILASGFISMLLPNTDLKALQ